MAGLIKRIFSEELPPELGKKFRMILMTGAATIFFGVIFVIYAMGIRFTALAFPILIGVCILVYGLLFKVSVLTNGVQVVTGTCIDHYCLLDFLPLGKKGVDGFLLRSDLGILFIPTRSRKNAPPIDTSVQVYIAGNSKYYDRAGIRHYITIYEYSLLPSEA